MVTNGTNGNSKKREETAARIIKAIGESNGLLTLAAKKAGIGYTTVNRYVHDFPSVHQAVFEAKERMLDFTEGKLFEGIKAGDKICIIFYLKTQGKARGYIERIEQDTTMIARQVHEVKITFENSDIRDALQNLVECGAVRISAN